MSDEQQKCSILVVAKDPDLRMIVRLAMEEAGYEVTKHKSFRSSVQHMSNPIPS